MFVLMNNEIRSRLFRAFPEAFINGNLEYIACPRQNSYFRLEDIEDERDLKAKILEWLSREAYKAGNKNTQRYHLNGINTFLGTSFTQEQMEDIYTYLGNRCNHQKTLRFIDSGYDMAVLTEEAHHGL